MKFEALIGMVLILLFVGMLTLAFNIHPVKASGTIYIRADGSVDPDTAPISSVDNVTYTFTDNIYDEIVVERDNIVVDGAGYILQGTGADDSIGIALSERSNVTIKNMEIEWFGNGILLTWSSNNVISGNDMANNRGGIMLYESSNNTIYGNNITANNEYGIVLNWSSNNTLRNNDASNNKYNFGVHVWELSHYIHDIDDSNTVNGKPIYYWINRRDMAVPVDAGYVALINCTNITLTDITLTNSAQGVLLVLTTNSTIAENNITANNEYGIYLYHSTGNSVYGNDIANNGHCGFRLHYSNHNSVSGNNITNNAWSGILLHESSNNMIYGNNIAGNRWSSIWLDGSSNNIISENTIKDGWSDGIRLDGSSSNTIDGNHITDNMGGIWLEWSSNYNTISGNTIINNDEGIRLSDSSNNIIYHNNFVSNTYQAVLVGTISNAWDDGYPSGGNYWSHRVCTGNPSDGSQPYTIDGNNVDRYPFQDPNGWLPYRLTVTSSPITGVTFTINGAQKTTAYSEWLPEGSFALEMPETHAVDGARYYWNQWSDGVTSRIRTVTMNTSIALTAYYTGPHYELTVTSSPITGIPFTINGVPQTTPYTEWLLEGSYTLVMPETYYGYVWSHWLEDGDTNRIKAVTLPGTTYTAVYTEPPIGGHSLPIKGYTAEKPLTLYLALVAILTVSFTMIKRKMDKSTRR